MSEFEKGPSSFDCDEWSWDGVYVSFYYILLFPQACNFWVKMPNLFVFFLRSSYRVWLNSPQVVIRIQIALTQQFKRHSFDGIIAKYRQPRSTLRWQQFSMFNFPANECQAPCISFNLDAVWKCSSQLQQLIDNWNDHCVDVDGQKLVCNYAV